MKKGTQKHPTLAVVDVSPAATGEIENALHFAATMRPMDDFWRERAAAELRTAFPGMLVYVGGCHIALHDGRAAGGSLGNCLGRVVEAKEERRAA